MKKNFSFYAFTTFRVVLNIVLRFFKSLIYDLLKQAKKRIRHASIRVNYPSLRFDNTCDIKISGRLSINGMVSIGSRTRIYVPKGSELIFRGDNYILNDVLIASDQIIDIGIGTSIQDRCILLGGIRIGSLCLIAPNVFISSGNHQINGGEHYSAFQPIKVLDKVNPIVGDEIIIGNDIWLGINSVIMKGVKIADGSIIGANSVLSKNTEKYGVYGGVPARKIRNRWIGPEKQLCAVTVKENDEITSD